MTRALRLAAATVVLAVAAACTGDVAHKPQPPSPSVSADAGTQRLSSPAAARRPPPNPPPERGCYRLAFAQLAEPTSSREPVDCSLRHTAQTIHLGELDLLVEGHALSVGSEHARSQLARVCPRRLAGFLGGTAETRRLSRFEVVWFSPTLPESDRGASWFRCDVVALAGRERLVRLPPPSRLRGVLDREGALATYGLCGTAEPGAPGFRRVTCGGTHTWRAISTIPIEGGSAYPGEDAVRRAGEEACRDEARARSEDPLQFRYGWEWPSRDQWEAGQHYGYCWMPD